MSTFTDFAAAAKSRLYSLHGEQATYAGQSVTLLPESGSEQTSQSIASMVLLARVRQSEVTKPAVDDKVIYGGENYRIGEGSYLDGEEWVLNMIPDHIDYIEV